MNGWLPCLTFEDAHWWMPLSQHAFTVIAESMAVTCDIDLLASSQTSTLTPPSFLRRRITTALVDDPALMIFTAIAANLPPADSADAVKSTDDTTPITVTLDDLADWLFANIGSMFLESGQYFAAPDLTPELLGRFRKLNSYFQTQAVTSWVQQADLWLEVTGPAIPFAWHQSWPQIDQESIQIAKEETGASIASLRPANDQAVLQKIARQSRDLRNLRSTFDAQLHHDKLASIKQLAYGLSHEINNPLANISTRAQQLQRDEQDASRHATLQRIVDQSYRAFEMIADLMFYANPSTPDDHIVDVAAEITTAIETFRSEADRLSIRLTTEPFTKEAKTHGDAAMIREAVGVLIRNSFEAIGCQGTVIVSIDTDEAHIRVCVADSGPGLSQEARKHAFDPYFSGREAGRGLGLGLCRAFRISQLHQGNLSLSAAPAGCVATLTLPRV